MKIRKIKIIQKRIRVNKKISKIKKQKVKNLIIKKEVKAKIKIKAKVKIKIRIILLKKQK